MIDMDFIGIELRKWKLICETDTELNHGILNIVMCTALNCENTKVMNYCNTVKLIEIRNYN